MSETPKTWIGSIVIDCRKFDEMIEFWMTALGYEQRGPRDEGWTLLFDPRGAGPNLAFRRDQDHPSQPWWYHLDLYSNDPESEVSRLTNSGATLLEARQPDRDFVTLADPDGNPFDVVDATGYRFGQRQDAT